MVRSQQPLQAINLPSGKSAASLQSDGIEPDFRNLVVALHMHMRRLFSIAGVEEETVWTDP